jgi:hypothetical protein
LLLVNLLFIDIKGHGTAGSYNSNLIFMAHACMNGGAITLVQKRGIKGSLQL